MAAQFLGCLSDHDAALAVFSNFCLARIFSIRYIGLDTLIRYIDDSLP